MDAETRGRLQEWVQNEIKLNTEAAWYWEKVDDDELAEGCTALVTDLRALLAPLEGDVRNGWAWDTDCRWPEFVQDRDMVPEYETPRPALLILPKEAK